MLRASILLLIVGLATVSAFGVGGRGQGSGSGSAAGGFGGKFGGTGNIDTGAHVAGSASAGNVGFLGGLFTASDVGVEGEAEGNLKASGTFGAQGGAYGRGEGQGEGSVGAGVGF